MLTIKNDNIAIKIDDELGGEIRSIKVGRHEFLANFDWKSPIEKRSSDSYGNATLDWLSEYRGGWQVLFPNAGNEATVLGVPLPFHGEFGRTKARVISKKMGEVTVEAGARLPLVLTRTYKLTPGKPIMNIKQSVKNESMLEVPFIWGEHPAFALTANSSIHMPPGPLQVDDNEMGELQDVTPSSSGVWPNAQTKTGGMVDLSVVPSSNIERLCYLHDRPEGWAAMEDGKYTFGISWDLTAFPHLWFWQENGGNGFPFYGRATITAVEPASSWPSLGLAAAIEKGQAFWLKPGETRTAWTTFSVSSIKPKNISQIKGIDQKGKFVVK